MNTLPSMIFGFTVALVIGMKCKPFTLMTVVIGDLTRADLLFYLKDDLKTLGIAFSGM